MHCHLRPPRRRHCYIFSISYLLLTTAVWFVESHFRLFVIPVWKLQKKLPPRSRSQSWVDPCGPNLGKCGVLQICFRFWINCYTRKRQRYKHHGDRNLIKIAGFWPGAKFRGWIGQMSEWILQLHPAWCVIYFWRRWPSLDIESLEVTKEKWKRKKRRQ